MKINRNMAFMIILIFPMIMQSCTAGTNISATTEASYPIKIQLLPYMSYIPLFIADKEGYFTEQNLKVEFVKLVGQDAFVALGKGDIDVAATLLNVAMLKALGEGELIKIVADKGYIESSGCAVYSLIARKDIIDSGELDDLSNLKGRKAVYDVASIQAYFLDKLLGTKGLTLSDVSLVELDSPASEIDAFANKSIDLSVQTEPWITRINNTGNTKTIKTFNEVIPNFQFGTIFFGPSILEKNPELGNRFMKAYLKAINQYNEGKNQENSKNLMEFAQLDQSLIDQVCWPTFRADGSINVESVTAFQDWAIQKGYLDKPVSADVFWDPAFIDKAKESLDTGN